MTAAVTADVALPRFETSFRRELRALQHARSGGAARDAVDLATIQPPAGDSGSAIGSGVASYYGREFAGRRTASGETFNPAAYTAAHRTLPFGSGCG
jgi:rare lipoprotein A